MSRYYNDLGHDQYRLELMGLQELGAEMPNATILKNHFDFIRSDHVRFWYLNDTDDSPSMPAVLITDMGESPKSLGYLIVFYARTTSVVGCLHSL